MVFGFVFVFDGGLGVWFRVFFFEVVCSGFFRGVGG